LYALSHVLLARLIRFSPFGRIAHLRLRQIKCYFEWLKATHKNSPMLLLQHGTKFPRYHPN